jgi:hypothetical protein
MSDTVVNGAIAAVGIGAAIAAAIVAVVVLATLLLI